MQTFLSNSPNSHQLFIYIVPLLLAQQVGMGEHSSIQEIVCESEAES